MKKPVALILICSVLASACATTNPSAVHTATPAAKPQNIKEWVLKQNRARKQAMVGALIGALAGAAAAGLRGDDPWTGAAAGAVAGAVVGFAVGKRQDRIFAQRDLAIQQAHYDSSQGYVARVEEVIFDPPQIKPGKKATIYVRYLVIGPNPNEGITVRMFRGLKYGDDYIMGAGPNEFVVPRGGGIVEATMEVTLPAKAAQGTYGVEALIEDSANRFPQAVGTNSLYIVADAGRSPHTPISRIASR
jgi:outer membrane lipoprotein SlyB